MDPAQVGEGPGAPPGLLPELPTGGLFRALAGLQMAAGELPEPLEEAGAVAPLDEPPAPALQDDDGREMMRRSSARSAAGDRPGVRQRLPRPAPGPDRARRTPGDPGEADRLAELHHRLVERPGPVHGHRGGERRHEAAAHRRGPGVPRFPGPPGHDPDPVRLDGRHRLPVGEAGDGRRDVRPDARQRFPFGPGRGESAVPGADDLPGGLPEVAGPGVVPGALPRLEDLGKGGPGEGSDVREPREEPRVVRERLLDPGLLEEDLRDPDAVRVPVLPPGQRTTVRVEPGEETTGPVRFLRGAPPGEGVDHGPAMPGKR